MAINNAATDSAIEAAQSQGLLAAIVDSEQKALLKKLRESERLLNESQRIGEVGSWELDLKTNSLHWSDEEFRIFGFRPQEFAPTFDTFLQRVHPEDRPLIPVRNQSDGTFSSSSELKPLDFRIIRPNGEVRTIHTVFEMVRDSEGKPLTLLGSTRDVTDQRHAEEALRRNEEYFRSLIENVSDSIAIIDPDGAIRYESPSIERIAGYKPAELVGKNKFDYIHSDDLPMVKDAIARALTAPSGAFSLTVENRHRHKDSSWRSLESSGKTFIGESGRLQIIVISRDVTERKELELQLRQAQRMEIIGQLAGGVAHDFNNLLTVIIGYSKLILPSLAESDPLTPKIREILKAGERAEMLTRQLLLFSNKQIVDFRILNLNDVISNVEKMLTRLIGEQVTLILKLDPALSPIKADVGEIEQILMNLSVNSKDAMPDGGRLTIETKNVELDAGYASTRLNVKPGRYVLLAITDTGCGMSKDVQAKIFAPFFTTKPVGTGLGLSIIYGIVQQSRGGVQVDSEPGQGTSFKLYFPNAGAQVGQSSPGRRDKATSVAKGSETILLVENDEPVRAVARQILQSSGYVVLEAKDAAEALKVAGAYERPIHVLVTAMVMPGLSGATLAELMIAARPDMKVVLMSGYTSVAASDLLKPGVQFMQKPFTPDVIVQAVQKALG